jgi:hypothetical protein
MSKTSEIIGSLAANFIVAGIVAKLQGAEAGGISFTIGSVLLAVYFLFFRKRSDPASLQPVTIQNNPNISPNISPTISPNISPTINVAPTIQIAPAAAAPATAPITGNRPKLTFEKWDYTSTTFDDARYGFFVRNHGETALDVQLQRFKIAEEKFALGATVATVPAYEPNGFIPVWLEGYGAHDPKKWDLLGAMKAASDMRYRGIYGQPDYIVPIAVRYKDFDDNGYETTANLHYIPARFELVFHAIHQSRIDDATEVLDYLRKNSRPGSATPQLVETIASAVGLSEERTAKALERLVAEGQVLRSQIDARWGYVYWYAHY